MSKKPYLSSFIIRDGYYKIRVSRESLICNGSSIHPGCNSIIKPKEPYLELNHHKISPLMTPGRRFLLCRKCGLIEDLTYNLL